MTGRRAIAVAGTHGKTTTTSMATLILQQAGEDPSFVIGGEISEAGSNGHHGTGAYFVVEADESDRSFLLYRPYVAIITNIDADHLNTYGDLAGLSAAFADFARLVRPGGFVVTCADNPGTRALADLLRGEGAFYVRAGSPFPEVTLALTVENEQQAMARIDGLAQRLGAFGGGGAPTATKIGDVDAKRLTLQNFAVYYAAFDGKLVITSATTGISELGEGGDKLTDDAAFTEAKEAAGMPDETAGFVYVNIEDAIPLLENFAQTAGEPLPNEARSNAEPLRSALFYATAEKGKATVKGFLRIE
jgi:hypothetical protein